MSAANSSGTYAVIFTSKRSDSHHDEYEKLAARMVELGKNQKGFLGIESVRGSDGTGITVSYWQSLEDIKAWKLHADHQEAQAKGRNQFYDSFKVRICKVEREY